MIDPIIIRGKPKTLDESLDQIETLMTQTTKMSNKSIKSFGSEIRANVRALWNGTFDFVDFINGMTVTIERGYERAWREGAKQCGILPGDRTIEETNALRQQIFADISHLQPFADFIGRNLKKDGGKLSAVQPRASIWTNRYNSVVSLAQTIACADQKFRWNLGSTREHCGDCAAYSGQVRRASVWASVGAKPQSQSLECHGYNCLCFFTQTDEPAIGGRPRRPSGG